MVSLQIGTGSVVSGSFSSIDWGNNSYFVETAADVLGGSNYSVISTTQFMSVPYALYAKSAGSSPSDNDWRETGSNIYRSTGNVGIGTTNPSYKLEVNGVIKGSQIEINGNQLKNTVSDLQIQLDGGKNTIMNGTSGNVGIGTTTPSFKLDVNGTARFNSQFDIYGTTRVTHFNWGANGDAYIRSGEDAGKIILQDIGGNVGIGTTSPSSKLEVSGNTRITGNLLMGGYTPDGTPSKIHIGSSNSDIPTGSDPALLYIGGDHNLDGTLFKVADYNNDGVSSKVVHFLSENNQDDYFFTPDVNGGKHYYRGKVGIGTTSPSSALHVKTTTQYQGIFLDDESGLIAKIARGDATGDPYLNLYSSISGKGVSIQSNQSSYFNGGNVGIGTTNPTKKLQLDVTTNNDGIFINGDNANDAKRITFGYNNASAEEAAIQADRNEGGTNNGGLQLMAANGRPIQFYTLGSSSGSLLSNTQEVMRVSGNGNVGIGTTSPTEKLHVNGHTKIQHISIQYANEINSESNIYLQHRNSRNTIICGGGGKLGVDVNSPTHKLHVAGDVMADGGWLRTTGPTGWYNQTYGGGWRMTDNNWIRSYGNKAVYISGSTGLSWSGRYFSTGTAYACNL